VNPYKIDIQSTYLACLPFTKTLLKQWASLPLQAVDNAELTLRFVPNDEIQVLSERYRHQNKPTNVMAFPSTMPVYIKQARRFIGDVVIAPDVLYQEHLEESKPLDAHWAHIIIHGVLHLLGHTHEAERPTHIMQTLEKKYLASLHFPDPYSLEHKSLD